MPSSIAPSATRSEPSMFRARLSSTGAPAATAQAMAASHTRGTRAQRPAPMSAPPSEREDPRALGASAGRRHEAHRLAMGVQRGRAVPEAPLEIADPGVEQAGRDGVDGRIHHAPAPSRVSSIARAKSPPRSASSAARRRRRRRDQRRRRLRREAAAPGPSARSRWRWASAYACTASDSPAARIECVKASASRPASAKWYARSAAAPTGLVSARSGRASRRRANRSWRRRRLPGSSSTSTTSRRSSCRKR